jgi:metal-responsive CopG/Arc/MetJ family transcriptional regulator
MAKKDRNFIIRVSEQLLEEFQQFCEENSMNASKRIRKYMENDIESWKKRKQQQNK